MDEEEALEVICRRNSGLDEIAEAIECLKLIEIESHGLPDENLEQIAENICSDGISTKTAKLLFRCLIPEKKVSEKCLKTMLAWVFNREREVAPALQIECYRWFLAILRYGLCDKNVFHPYYLVFTFNLLNNGDNPKLAATAISIIYFITKPEDAKRFYIEMFLEEREKNPMSQWNALLSLMKSYQPLSVPENIGACELHVPDSVFDCGMKNAFERCLIQNDEEFGIETGSANLDSPHPTELKAASANEKALSAIRSIHLCIPTQTISFLTSLDGIYQLGFSNYFVQSRFTSSLAATLDAVFLKCSGGYSGKEKTQLVQSIFAMQEALQQSIAVVNRFLIQFLQIWDGIECKSAIYKLLQWFVFDSLEEWRAILPPLQLLFRSSSLEDRCLLLNSLTCLTRNMITTMHRSILDKPPLLLQDNNSQSLISTALNAISTFVQDALLETLPQSIPSTDVRQLLTEALDYYHYVALAVNFADVPAMILAPGVVVYTCLLSNSPLIIERMCSLLMKYGSTTTQERLHRLGIYFEYEEYFAQQYKSFLVDFYRVLFSSLKALPRTCQGIFDDKFVSQFNGIAATNGVEAIEALRIENSILWCTKERNRGPSIFKMDIEKMRRLFPATFALKDYVESS